MSYYNFDVIVITNKLIPVIRFNLFHSQIETNHKVIQS